MQIRLLLLAMILQLNSALVADEIRVGFQNERQVNAAFNEDVICKTSMQSHLTGKLDVAESKALTVKAKGQSTVSLSGTANTLRVAVDGQSKVDLSTLRASDFKYCGVDGQGHFTGRVDADGSKSLTVKARGQATASLTGTAGTLYVSVGGQAAVDLSSLKASNFEYCEVYGQGRFTGIVDADQAGSLAIKASGQSTISLSGTAGTVRVCADGQSVENLSGLKARKVELYGVPVASTLVKAASGSSGTVVFEMSEVTVFSEEIVEFKNKSEFKAVVIESDAITGEEMYRIVLEGIAATVMLIGMTWLCIEAFQVSIWWGLGCLLMVAEPFFLLMHFKKGLRPFLLMMISGLFWMWLQTDEPFWSTITFAIFIGPMILLSMFLLLGTFRKPFQKKITGPHHQ